VRVEPDHVLHFNVRAIMFALAHAALLQRRRPRVVSQPRCWGLPCLLLTLLCTLLAPSPVHACGAVDGGATSCNGGNGDNVASLGNTSGTNNGAGNPINVMTGNKYQREVDLPALPGVLGLEIVRHYNSAYSGPTLRTGAFGRGWKLSYETELFDVAGKVQVVQADGSRILFDHDPLRPNLCASRNPANGSMVLHRQTDGRTEYDWTWTDGRRLHFNAAGRLETIRAPSGETVHLLYDSRNLLVRVIDPFNRSLSLIYPDRPQAPNCSTCMCGAPTWRGCACRPVTTPP